MLPLTVDLLAVPKAVPELRRMLRARFAGEDVTDLVLCVGELLSNVVTHVGEGTPVTLRVSGTRTGRIRVELRDPAPGIWPTLRSAAAGDESGRGLLLVDALALGWGVEQAPYGKTVWCELRAPALPALREDSGGRRVVAVGRWAGTGLPVRAQGGQQDGRSEEGGAHDPDRADMHGVDERVIGGVRERGPVGSSGGVPGLFG